MWYALRRKDIDIPYPVRTLRMETQVASHSGSDAFEREIMTELRAMDFLRNLRDEELRMLLPEVTLLKFGAGEVIVREGDRENRYTSSARARSKSWRWRPTGSRCISATFSVRLFLAKSRL